MAFLMFSNPIGYRHEKTSKESLMFFIFYLIGTFMFTILIFIKVIF